MAKQLLSALLSDKNVPEKIKEYVIERLLMMWSENSGGLRVVDYPSKYFVAEDLRNTRFAGPKIHGLPAKIRVARIMSFERYLKYFMQSAYYSKDKFRNEQQIAEYLFCTIPERDVTLSSMGVTWTCLDEELRGQRLLEIENGLGLFHLLPGELLVAITYTIDSSELHVPTVLDVGLQPGFVSKPDLHEGQLPRAWDWKYGRWGFSEMVHRNGVSIRDPDVRLLGRTSGEFRSYYDGLLNFIPSQSPILEDVVAQTLRQVEGHNELEPFLSGKSGILEISPREFELFLSSLYARKGYRTKVMKTSWDGGFDVIAFHDSHHEDGLLIQAKHTRKTVGISLIRELIGARFLVEGELASYILVVATTGKFSKPAIKAGEEHPSLLRLIDYDELQKELQMIKNMGHTDIVRKAVSQAQKANCLTRE